MEEENFEGLSKLKLFFMIFLWAFSLMIFNGHLAFT